MLQSPAVMNQGSQRTCCAYAFSHSLSQGLLSKYAKATNPQDIVSMIKALCPCWEGHHVERMAAEWNKKHTQDGAQIERLDNKERFRVKLNFQKIENFDEAYRNMEISQAREMYMPCIMQTAPQDHKLHAVALTACIEEGKMEAFNSHGARDPFLQVTRENFVCCMTHAWG